MQELDLVKHIFRTSSNGNIICPPDQVFLNPDLEFLLTIGGHLADNAEEFNKLTTVFKEIGESEFFIVENLGATTPHNDEPYINIFCVEDTFAQFDETVKKFDPPFGFFINHFYVFGRSKNWGIYICECPTINIIGCTTELKDKFANVFNIKANGWSDLADFVDIEFQGKDDLKRLLIEAYKLA